MENATFPSLDNLTASWAAQRGRHAPDPVARADRPLRAEAHAIRRTRSAIIPSWRCGSSTRWTSPTRACGGRRLARHLSPPLRGDRAARRGSARRRGAVRAHPAVRPAAAEPQADAVRHDARDRPNAGSDPNRRVQTGVRGPVQVCANEWTQRHAAEQHAPNRDCHRDAIGRAPDRHRFAANSTNCSLPQARTSGG